jgi:hypothetical protein
MTPSSIGLVTTKESVKNTMIDEASQSAVDNMVAGYIKIFTGLDAEVTELGNVHLTKKFAGTHNVNIATARDESDLVLLLTDDDDPSMLVEETPGDLAEIAERITEINELSEEEVTND